MLPTSIYSKYNALMTDEIPQHFGDPQKEFRALIDNAGAWFHSNHPFTLSGDGVQRWCNGMLTNNIRRLAPNQGNRNAVCSPKGILEGLLDVYCLDDNRFLCLPEGIDADWFGQRFRQFLFLDDIDLDPLDTHVTVRLLGPKANELALAIGFSKPEEDTQVNCHPENGWAIFTRRYGLPCVDVVTPENHLESIVDDVLKCGGTLTGQRAYDHCRVQRREAAWPNDRYSEKPLIHALRLNSDCCAFDKGCYVGQEIINRIDVKGKLAKQLHLLKLSGPAPVGSSLCHNGRHRATLTSSSSLDEAIGLAVLPKAYWEQGTVFTIGDGVETATVVEPLTTSYKSAIAPE